MAATLFESNFETKTSQCVSKSIKGVCQILVDMDGVVLNDVLQGGLSGEESQFLLAQAVWTLLLRWRQNFGSVIFLVEDVLTLSSTSVSLDLCRVDFSKQLLNLTVGENIDGDIFRDEFQLKCFNLLS